MAIKPILFNSEMVQAILAGRKTQTRREIKPTSKKGSYGIQVERSKVTGDVTNVAGCDEHGRTMDENGSQYPVNNKYQIGDILWVRETWRKIQECNSEETIIQYAADKPDSLYLVDGDGFQMFNKNGTEKLVSWKPSIHMPKEAARIFLKVTDVRVERLQDISEEDAKLEGVETKPYGSHPGFCTIDYSRKPYNNGFRPGFCADTGRQFRSSFQSLWQSIHDSESWNQNPFVWVYTFEVVEKPENFLAE